MSSKKSRSRRKAMNDRDPMAPKPIRPRAIRYHGLFGSSIATQHLIVDDRWTPSSLIEIYSTLNTLLKNSVSYGRHEVKYDRVRQIQLSKSIKLQCANGRLKLQKITFSDNAHKIHNILRNYKDMQRLYQRMPIYQVLENINQRTFAMRKEQDRLQDRLNQLKGKYKMLLLERSRLHNRLIYQDVKPSEEELNIHMLLKKIQNSKVRLNAIRIINTTYKKMKQILVYDEIFYEHILNSLYEDIEDQKSFIQHILYLGMPAIAKFRVLNKAMLNLEVKVRKDLKSKIDIVNNLKTPKIRDHQEKKVKEILTANPKRYIRFTDSMMILKKELASIESTIKNLKQNVLASQAKEIYPRFKTQVENNNKLYREVHFGIQSREMILTKMKCSSLLSEVLVNNLSLEEINRLEHISELKKTLKTEQEIEDEHYEYLQNRADVYVLLRLNLWNLFNMLINIDPPNPRATKTYKSSALRLPLLKFELFEARAIAPEMFTENVDTIMFIVKRRIYNLMKGFQPHMMDSIEASREKYHEEFLNTTNSRFSVFEDNQPKEEAADLIIDKSLATIPNRKQIKALSAKVVEQSIKREE